MLLKLVTLVIETIFDSYATYENAINTITFVKHFLNYTSIYHRHRVDHKYNADLKIVLQQRLSEPIIYGE